MMNVQIITDNDLDGIVAALVIEYALKLKGNYNIGIRYTHHSTLLRMLENMDPDHIDWLILTDLAPDNAHLLKRFPCRITVIDHHLGSVHRLADQPYVERFLNTSGQHCAASLALLYAKEHILGSAHPNYTDLSVFNRLVEITRDWDLWILKIPESRILALAADVMDPRIIHSELKRYLDLESRQEFQITWINRTIYQAYAIALKEIEESEELAIRTQTHLMLNWNGMVCNFITAVCFGYASMVADFLNRSNGGDNVILLLDLKTRRFSLRTDRSDIDVSQIAKRFGGGGHPKAAGFEHEIAFNSLFKDMGRFGEIIANQLNQPLEIYHETVSRVH